MYYFCLYPVVLVDETIRRLLFSSCFNIFLYFFRQFFPIVFLWLRVEFVWLFKDFQQEILGPFLSPGIVKIKKLFPKVKEEFPASWHFLYPSSGFNRKIVFAMEMVLTKVWIFQHSSGILIWFQISLWVFDLHWLKDFFLHFQSIKAEGTCAVYVLVADIGLSHMVTRYGTCYLSLGLQLLSFPDTTEVTLGVSMLFIQRRPCLLAANTSVFVLEQTMPSSLLPPLQ